MTVGANPPPPRAVVLDTNVVLDLLLFADPSVQPLRTALDSGQVAWLATGAMRDELQRVLAYPALQQPMATRGLQAAQVLARFDAACQLQLVAPACAIRCSDRDDQLFIDLAVAHRAWLLSKDKAVLRLRRRLAQCAVPVQSAFRPAA